MHYICTTAYVHAVDYCVDWYHCGNCICVCSGLLRGLVSMWQLHMCMQWFTAWIGVTVAAACASVTNNFNKIICIYNLHCYKLRMICLFDCTFFESIIILVRRLTLLICKHYLVLNKEKISQHCNEEVLIEFYNIISSMMNSRRTKWSLIIKNDSLYPIDVNN